MMGGGLSLEENLPRLGGLFFQSVQKKQMLPDISIDQSILKFSGLDSVSALEKHTAQLLDDLPSKGPAFLKDLRSALSAFDHVPAAVGLGALVTSFILDLTISGLMETQNNGKTMDVVRRMFGKEKASSGVQDSIDEYVKRFRLNMTNPEELLKDTERMEKKLSGGLTRLRNSMFIDSQMSSCSMKHWVNGAAFHLLMLVHLARMKMAKGPGSEVDLNRHVVSISCMAEHYGNDLQNLLVKFKTCKHSTIYTNSTEISTVFSQAGLAFGSSGCEVYDKELGRTTGTRAFSDSLFGFRELYSHFLTEPYLNHMFNNWEVLGELREFFLGVKQNLKKKILQNSEFKIQKFLPDLSKKKK